MIKFNKKEIEKMRLEKKLHLLVEKIGGKTPENNFQVGNNMAVAYWDGEIAINILIKCEKCKLYVYSEMGDNFGIEDGGSIFKCNDCID